MKVKRVSGGANVSQLKCCCDVRYDVRCTRSFSFVCRYDSAIQHESRSRLAVCLRSFVASCLLVVATLLSCYLVGGGPFTSRTDLYHIQCFLSTRDFLTISSICFVPPRALLEWSVASPVQ